MLSAIVAALLIQATEPAPVPIAASILPPSRHAIVSGDPVTFFAAMVNQGAGEAFNCRVEISDAGPFTYTYRAFDPATNTFTAPPNTPVNIPAGSSQIYVLGFEFSAAMAGASIEPAYVCDNGEALPVHELTSLTLAASATPQPDILALASTNGPPGVNFGIGNSVFAVSITNLNGEIGTAIPIEVAADRMDRTYHARLLVCEIDDQAQCLTERTDTLVSQLNGRESRSFAIWVGGHFSYTATLYDIIRIRALIRDPDTGEMYGSTSVAHSGFPFNSGFCAGQYPSTIWTGSITHQSASDAGGAWQIATRVDDLNIYGDGEGQIFAVPIDGIGPRFRGTVANSFAHDPNMACLAAQSNEVRLDPMAVTPGEPPAGEAWQGRLRWTVTGVSGEADVEPGSTILANLIRGTFTQTDRTVFPIDFIPGNHSLQTPPDGYSGSYTAHFLGDTGVARLAEGWTVGEDDASGPVTFDNGSGGETACTLSFAHAPVVTLEFPDSSDGDVFSPRENFRRAIGEISGCDDGNALAAEGPYDGVMIYQPMTVAGEPDENGLEVILTPSNADEPQHMLWFLLRP